MSELSALTELISKLAPTVVNRLERIAVALERIALRYDLDADPDFAEVPDAPDTRVLGDLEPEDSPQFHEPPTHKHPTLNAEHPPWPTDLRHCPRCGSAGIDVTTETTGDTQAIYRTCKACGYDHKRAVDL